MFEKNIIPKMKEKFPNFFWFYLFLFIPLYLFFVNQYVIIVQPSFVPDSIKIIKDFVWLLILIGFIFWLILKKGRIDFPREIGILLLPFLLYLIFQLFRGYFTLGLFGTALAIRNILFYIPAVLIAPLLIQKKEDFLKITKYFSLIIFFAGLYGLIQFLFNSEIAHYILERREPLKSYITSFFPDYNSFCWFLAMSFPFVTLFDKYGNKKTLSLLIIGLAIFSSIVSQSRTGLITFLFVLFSILILRVVKFWRIIIPTILIVSFLLIFTPDVIKGHRIKQEVLIFDTKIRDEQGLMSNIRVKEVWPGLWQYFIEKPILGHGLGVFGTAGYTVLSRKGIITPFLVDNFYYTLLLNTGIIGLILFLLLIIAIFWYSIKIIRRTKDKFIKDFLMGIDISLIVFLIFSLTANFLESFPESVYFWFLIGAIPAIEKICPEK